MTIEHFSPIDFKMMSKALTLAKKGIYTARPNPMVGCVICIDENIIGEGFHKKYGENHAEINALSQVDNAKNSTVYLTLEPCFHTAKTAPCVNALIQAKVKKVIIAMLDPNPLVSGKGIKVMQDAGIEVLVGLLEEQAKKLNRGFIKRMLEKKPFVTAKIAISLDGKTAMASGESKWITGEQARVDVQKLRAKSDAILTGVNTILYDNANLTVRDINCKQPLRVILDSKKKFKDQQYFNICQDGNNNLILNNPNLEDALNILGNKEINNVLLEAGSTLLSSMLKNKLIDELIIYTSPILLGNSARNVLNINIEKIADKIELKTKDIRIIGKDIKTTYEISY